MTENQALLIYDVDENIWEVVQNYYDNLVKVMIPVGYKTNLASVPRIFWVFVAPYELSENAPLVHDYLYDHAGISTPIYNPDGTKNSDVTITKYQADKYFRQIMKLKGVGIIKRNIAFWAVKLFAGSAWKSCEDKNVKK